MTGIPADQQAVAARGSANDLLFATEWPVEARVEYSSAGVLPATATSLANGIEIPGLQYGFVMPRQNVVVTAEVPILWTGVSQGAGLKTAIVVAIVDANNALRADMTLRHVFVDGTAGNHAAPMIPVSWVAQNIAIGTEVYCSVRAYYLLGAGAGTTWTVTPVATSTQHMRMRAQVMN